MKTPINVLYLVLSMGLSGRGVAVLELVRNLKKDIYNCTVCCFDERGILADELEKEGVEVIVMRRKSGLDFSLILKLAGMMKERKIDIVHAYNAGPFFYGSLAAKISRIPVCIVSFTALSIAIDSRTWKKRLQNKLCSYLVEKMVTVTEGMKADFARRNGIPPGKIDVIRYGVDFNKYNIQMNIKNGREKFGIKPSDIVLGTIARLVPEKGHVYLFEAIKEVAASCPEIKLILVGDGPLHFELEKSAERLGIAENVKFFGYHSDIPELLSLFDIFVLPSVFEPFGIVLLEAMAAGKPVIATAISEIPKIVADGKTGILVPPKDASALSSAIVELVRDPHKRQMMGKNGMERVVGEFSLEKSAAGYKHLYQDLLASKNKRKKDNKIKIMHVVLSLDCGGLEHLVVELSNALNRGKFCPSICCLDRKGDLGKKAADLGIEVVEMHRKPGVDLALIFKLAHIFWKKKVDIVHTHNPSAHFYGTLAARLALVPTVINTRHGVGIKAAPVGNALIWRLTNKVIAVSERVRDKLLKNDRLKPGKVITIPNGVDTEKFESKDIRIKKNDLGIEETAPLIGIVARLSGEKDHKTLLNAFAIVNQNLHRARLLVVGDGFLRKNLEEICREKGLNGTVLFLGYRDDIPDLLKLMDVFVLSSVSEGLSLTLLEAMAAGKPIVATQVGGNPEVVVDKVTGRLVPPGAPQALAEALMDILTNSDMAREMGLRAQERVKRLFSLPRFVKDHEALYAEFVKK